MFLQQGFRAGPGPESDFWFQPLHGGTSSGVRVTATTSFNYSTVYKCVRAYHDAIGSMPRRLMRQVDERKRERVLSHPVARLISVKPNRWQTPSAFVGMLEAHAQLRGCGYARVVLNRRYEPEELQPIHPDRVTTEVMLNGLPRWQVRAPAWQPGAAPETLLPGELLCVPNMSLDGYVGISPVEAQREAIGAAIAARDFGSRFWNNDARPPFWIEVPGKFQSNDDKREFREGWQAAYGGANRGKPGVLDRGMKLHELGLKNTDSQWLESREHNDVDICGIWRVPPHKVGILRDAKYANIESQAIEWVTDSLLPRIVAWEEAFQRDLLGYDDELYVKFVPDQLLRGDIKARYEAYGKAIQDGWMTRNEVRSFEDRDPLAGLDEPLQPLNMTRAGQALPVPARDRGARAQAILEAAADRVARREAALVTRLATGTEKDAPGAWASYTRFVGDVLALPAEVAQGYVDKVQARIEHLRGADQLQSITVDEWVDTQYAALLRLGA